MVFADEWRVEREPGRHTNKRAMGKDKKAKAPITLGIGGLAGAIGAYSSSPATGPSLLSAVLGDSSLDGEAQVLLKKLGKRDTTTKLKALVELHATLRDKGAEWAAEFLPHWCLAFGRLAADISWQVREQACSALGVVAALLGRQLAPQLRTLMPPWLCCKCDAQHDVRRAAAAAFTAAFPNADKEGSALLYCREELVAGLTERALATPPPKPSDKEEAAEAAEIRENLSPSPSPSPSLNLSPSPNLCPSLNPNPNPGPGPGPEPEPEP